VFAEAPIHIDVGSLDITWFHLTGALSVVCGSVVACVKLVMIYLRERDARDAARLQQVFDMAQAMAKMTESLKSATGVHS